MFLEVSQIKRIRIIIIQIGKKYWDNISAGKVRKSLILNMKLTTIFVLSCPVLIWALVVRDIKKQIPIHQFKLLHKSQRAFLMVYYFLIITQIQCSNSSWACHWHHRFGTINYTPFQHTIKNQVFIPALDFSFFAKIRLEITNTWCGVNGDWSKQEWWCQNS